MQRERSPEIGLLLDLAPVSGKAVGAKYEPEVVLEILRKAKAYLEAREIPGQLPPWAARELVRLEGKAKTEGGKAKGKIIKGFFESAFDAASDEPEPGGIRGVLREHFEAMMKGPGAGQGAPRAGAKYKSRKWSGERWIYDYGDGQGFRDHAHEGPKEAPPRQLDEDRKKRIKDGADKGKKERGPSSEAPEASLGSSKAAAPTSLAAVAQEGPELLQQGQQAKEKLTEALGRMPGKPTVVDPQGRTWVKTEAGWAAVGKVLDDEAFGEHMVSKASEHMEGKDDAHKKARASLTLYLSMSAFAEGAVPGRDAMWDARADALRGHTDKLFPKEEKKEAGQQAGRPAGQPGKVPVSLEDKARLLAEQKRLLREEAEHKLVDQQLQATAQALEEAQRQASGDTSSPADESSPDEDEALS